jgi:hypothetical protein
MHALRNFQTTVTVTTVAEHTLCYATHTLASASTRSFNLPTASGKGDGRHVDGVVSTVILSLLSVGGGHCRGRLGGTLPWEVPGDGGT